jgi:Fic family protein
MKTLTERLLEKPTLAESELILHEEALLEELRQKIDTLSAEEWQDGLPRLAQFRLKSSSTLKSGAVESWQQANAWVAEKIQREESPTWEDVLHINAILLNAEKPGVRSEAVYLGPHEACPISQLSENIEIFKSQILNIQSHRDPIEAAAMIQYWLVSIHPFMDGNGRTAVLVADWILGSYGYLPLSFATRLDSLVATLSSERASATAGNAILKLIKNLQLSYRLVLGL